MMFGLYEIEQHSGETKTYLNGMFLSYVTPRRDDFLIHPR